MILTSKKVILFPIIPQDFEILKSLISQDEKGHLGLTVDIKDAKKVDQQLVYMINTASVWTVETKEGRKSKKIGFVFLRDFNGFSCSIGGMLDKSIITGLIKQMKKGVLTYAEDVIRTVSMFAFEQGVERIEAMVREDNRIYFSLLKQAGFKKEGKLRNADMFSGKLHNAYIMGLIKEDYNVREPKDKLQTA